MEAFGVVPQRVPCIKGAGSRCRSYTPSFSNQNSTAIVRLSGELRITGRKESGVCLRTMTSSGLSNHGFCDKGHLQYYEAPRCGGKKEKIKEIKTIKKKLKLFKGLADDLTVFSQLGFGVDPNSGLVGEVQSNKFLEATEVLLKQLQQLRAEEKELKRKVKQDKVKLKARRAKSMVDSESSSSGSSDSETGEIVDLGRLRDKANKPSVIQEALQFIQDPQPLLHEMQPVLGEEQQIKNELQTVEAGPLVLPKLPIEERSGFEDCSCSREECSCGSGVGCSTSTLKNGTSFVMGASAKRIEVCMGAKCKKSGAAALLAEFEKAVGNEGTVVGCKCMGKCRDGPNVRVASTGESIQANETDISVKSRANNPLCIGVGLEDVDVILSNFLLKDERKYLSLT